MRNTSYSANFPEGGGLKQLSSFVFGHKNAFTLAEVLITLGIIGVVAAMTLPSVINKYRRNVVETRLAKFYSVMNQALARAKSEKGELVFEQTDLTDSKYLESWYRDNITKYIKTIYEEGSEKIIPIIKQYL